MAVRFNEHANSIPEISCGEANRQNQGGIAGIATRGPEPYTERNPALLWLGQGFGFAVLPQGSKGGNQVLTPLHIFAGSISLSGFSVLALSRRTSVVSG